LHHIPFSKENFREIMYAENQRLGDTCNSFSSPSSEASVWLMRREALLQGLTVVNTSKPKLGMPLLPCARLALRFCALFTGT
jgi:hypothetical protein